MKDEWDQMCGGTQDEADLAWEQEQARMRRPPSRASDRRVHPCGCVTEFDHDAWESVVVHRCTLHEQMAPATPGGAA